MAQKSARIVVILQHLAPTPVKPAAAAQAHEDSVGQPNQKLEHQTTTLGGCEQIVRQKPVRAGSLRGPAMF